MLVARSEDKLRALADEIAADGGQLKGSGVSATALCPGPVLRTHPGLK